jgi:phosphate transport system substrate-binding protein
MAVTSSAAPLVEQLSAGYQAGHSYLQIETLEHSADGALQAVAEGEADLAVVERDLEAAEALDPETWKPRLRAWPIGRGGLVVVVHPSNPVRGLSLAELQQVFAGNARRWTDLGGEDRTLRLVTREAGAPLRLLMEREVLQGSPLAGTAVVMPNDQAVASYVAEQPEAIGYLSASWVTTAVKALAVDGAWPDPASVAAGHYPLTYPLVVVTPTAISGKAKGFVEYCLGEEGQQAMGERYAPLEAKGN